MSIYALGDRRPSFGEGSWIAHNATIVGSVHAGRNVSVWYNVVMRGDNDPITIGDGSLIGINAVILNKAVIGKECIIGANALIPAGKVIPERSLVVGSPGRVIRTLTDNEIEHLKWNAQHYVDNARLYEQELCALEPSSVIGAKEA